MTSCILATEETLIPDWLDSSTARSFSSSVQCLRRWTLVTTSTRWYPEALSLALPPSLSLIGYATLSGLSRGHSNLEFPVIFFKW